MSLFISLFLYRSPVDPILLDQLDPLISHSIRSTQQPQQGKAERDAPLGQYTKHVSEFYSTSAFSLSTLSDFSPSFFASQLCCPAKPIQNWQCSLQA